MADISEQIHCLLLQEARDREEGSSGMDKCELAIELTPTTRFVLIAAVASSYRHDCFYCRQYNFYIFLSVYAALYLFVSRKELE